MRNLLGIESMSRAEIERVLDASEAMLEISQRETVTSLGLGDVMPFSQPFFKVPARPLGTATVTLWRVPAGNAGIVAVIVWGSTATTFDAADPPTFRQLPLQTIHAHGVLRQYAESVKSV